MATSIGYKDGAVEFVINIEQICYLAFNADGTVSIQFAQGGITKFSNMSDKDKENLRRQLRIQPTY
jgi:hypothetical protein